MYRKGGLCILFQTLQVLKFLFVRMAQINLTNNAGKAKEGYHTDVYFAVEDSHCNAHKLKLSWVVVSILEEWLVFYSDLREIPKTS